MMKRITRVQECDATEDDSSTKVGYKNVILNF